MGYKVKKPSKKKIRNSTVKVESVTPSQTEVPLPPRRTCLRLNPVGNTPRLPIEIEITGESETDSDDEPILSAKKKLKSVPTGNKNVVESLGSEGSTGDPDGDLDLLGIFCTGKPVESV